MRFLSLLAAATPFILAGQVLAQDHEGGHAATPSGHGPGWSYSGPGGPEYWARLDSAWAACAAGQQESPIDISGAISADLGPLDLQWRRLPARVFDTGHAIQVEASPGSNLTMGNKGYQLLQFHVHQPSEHLLNGHRYPLEIHFVHTAPDGTLGVVGVFAEPGESNPALQSVLEAVTTPGEADDRPTLDLTALLPEQRDYFRYEGSLTTPPCSETVAWAVLAEPITVSEAQIEAFSRLHPGNTRPLQPLNRRFLLRSGR
ncbi:MAG: carbonic anhydrase family protein [Brevundimonas sp.]|uniref:carbonic anhydrase n=1 Tax=Brevundimonas sp. TaxID=1871086 RepID=UPI0027324988|nr:carbonic anhydrase family protein [Brevundimonas sp.]MDP3404719.1 carbonic anhydrase family protein [Brevundimonas sp.]